MNLNKIVDKKSTKTYEKYLNVINNTLDFRSYLKQKDPRKVKKHRRVSQERSSFKGKLVISPTNVFVNEFGNNNFSSTKGTIHSKTKHGVSSGLLGSLHDRSDSRYSKQIEAKMVQHMIEASFTK